MSTYFYPASFVAGFSTGLRSMTAPAVTLAAGKSAWTGLAGTLAVGEVLADKLPVVPARTQAGPLFGRALFGALCGWAIAGRAGRSQSAGAAVAALGAIASAYGGYYARKFIDERVGIPDPVVALAEDGLAFGLARLANA
jgi:uncharacterized membrane protein